MSAASTKDERFVIPPNTGIDRLGEMWRDLKAKEDVANERRREVEQRIEALIKLPAKGTTRVGGLKIVTGTTESWDQNRLRALQQTWPKISDLPFPFETEFKPNSFVKAIREEHPGVWAKLKDALSSKPKKPSFSVDGKNGHDD